MVPPGTVVGSLTVALGLRWVEGLMRFEVGVDGLGGVGEDLGSLDSHLDGVEPVLLILACLPERGR